jgi:hypothetical protein
LFAAVGGQFALTAITNKIIGRILVLDHVEPMGTSYWVSREER